jgi:aminomethyltransferase
VWTRDVKKLAPGRVAYGSWCDEAGKVLDDGTVCCLEPERYRMTAADPAYAWLTQQARGFAVEIEDQSASLAALAVQGPTSRAVLDELCEGALGPLGFFHATRVEARGLAFDVTRTGYTGDLGYELWIAAERAPELWDVLVDAGAKHGLAPVGLDALDVTRVEAGFILGGVDYTGARAARIESQKSTPFELGLGWAVHLERDEFIGRAALEREAREGPRHALVGLVIDWEALESLYDRFGLPPHLPTAAWRSSVPVYEGAVQVGRATSGAWSPTLKKKLALATVLASKAEPGTRLDFEVTVEHERHTVPATVVARPFFDPPRKKGRG